MVLQSVRILNYKNKILDCLNQSESIVELIGKEWSHIEAINLSYKNFYPYEYMDHSIEPSDCYVNFDIKTSINPTNKTYSDMTVSFFIAVPLSDMKTPNGSRPDKIAIELDNLFHGKNIFGIGKGMITSNVPYSPNTKYHGRILTYQLLDFHYGSKS